MQENANHLRRQQAFTLIEIMLVISIMAMVVMGATMGLGAITRSNLRAASMKVASATKFAYSRAVTQGTTTRLHFDLEEGTLAVQESQNAIVLRQENDDENTDDAADPWAEAKSKLDTLDAPKESKSPFSNIRNDKGITLKKFDAQPVGNGIRVLKIITPRSENPITNGQGSIHFFPGGITEHCVVQLADKNDHVFSIEIHPLTGNAKIHNYAYEPTDLVDEESEVRDRS